MPFIPHTPADERDMLSSIGAASIDELFDEIPAKLRSGRLTEVPAGVSEMALLRQMNERSREVFRRVVEGYLSSGEPVGSRTLTRSMSEKVSAATIRNVMQDLEFLGLLDSPHVSAGRVPTQQGLRMFVDALLETGDLARDDRAALDASLG